LDKLARAYGLPYVRIASDEEIAGGVSRVMDMEGPVLCEVLGDMRFDEIPKCVSSVNAAGERVSAALENPWPFLPENRLSAIYARLDAAIRSRAHPPADFAPAKAKRKDCPPLSAEGAGKGSPATPGVTGRQSLAESEEAADRNGISAASMEGTAKL
jgi:hypothetical protein